MRTLALRWLPVLAAIAAGCNGEPYEIDQFPVAVDLTPGVPLVKVSATGLDDEVRTAVIDTASPLTQLDDGGETTRRAIVDLTLAQPDGVARARFTGVEALIRPLGSVGRGTPAQVGGVIGGDVLMNLAMRFEAAESRVRFFPDIAGTQSDHEASCSAVLSTPREGGGQFVVQGAVVKFEPTRLVVSACLGAPPTPLQRETNGDLTLDLQRPVPRGGRDSQLVLATGLPITVLTMSAYLDALGEDPSDLTPGTLFLPGGDPGGEPVLIGTIAQLALLAGAGQNSRAPCAELAASRTMERCGCLASDRAAGTCVCDSDGLCPAGAVVELGITREPLDQREKLLSRRDRIVVAVISDTHPIIQGLRGELRPDVAEVDGLLGVSTLSRVVVDVDYPGARVIVRCATEGDPKCLERPSLFDTDRTDHQRACLLRHLVARDAECR